MSGEHIHEMPALKYGLHKNVVLYMSSVWAIQEQRKEYETMTMLLDVKRVKYKEIDLSLKENTGEKLALHAKSKTRALPQLWVDDKYIGCLDELREINEQDQWQETFGV